MPCTIETTAIRNVTPISTPTREKKLLSFCARMVPEGEADGFEQRHLRPAAP